MSNGPTCYLVLDSGNRYSPSKTLRFIKTSPFKYFNNYPSELRFSILTHIIKMNRLSVRGVVLYTFRQSQILVTTFNGSGPRSLSDNSLPQMKSHKTLTVYFDIICSCLWSACISRSRSWQDDMMQMTFSVLLHLLMGHFWRPLKTKKGASDFFHFQEITTRP